MNNIDTIVAISTPQGSGAMAIVRMSGKDSLSILKLLSKKDSFKPRHATLCSVYDESDELIDEAIVIYFKAPHSYTKEDVCEIQCHGGLMSARMILKACVKRGARLALPGEFSKRAFLNGRIDFSQVNAIAKLINSKSENATKVLARQLKGELGNFVSEARENLLRLLAYSEVMIDYSEEDIPADNAKRILSQLLDIKERLQRIYDFSKMREGMFEGYSLSIIGKPNVGKSSILNAILLYDRAIISPIAGTTRDTIEESIQIGGDMIKIIDTAGIRHTDDVIESLGIEKSLLALKESDIVLSIFDTSKELDEEDLRILDLLNQEKPKHCIVVLNKSDLPPLFDFSQFREMIQIPYAEISLSAKDSQNCALSIKEMLLNILQNTQVGNEMILTSTFQIEATKKALESIQEAMSVFEHFELELFSYNINDAIQVISSITQPYEISEMFEKMFGEFCLGK